MRSTAGLALLVALSVCGCGDDPEIVPDARCCGPPPSDGGGGLFGPFAMYFPGVPGYANDWGTIPFPNDLYVDGAGTLGTQLNGLPVGVDGDEDAANRLRDALGTVNGAAPS